MSKSRFLIAVMVAVVFSACNTEKKDQEASDTQARIEPVRIAPLDYQTVARDVDYTANLQAYEEIHMTPATPGRIEKIYVEVGARVSKGDILVQMDRTQLHQAEVQLRTIETDLKRFDTLQKAGSIAQQQYDQLEAQVEIAKNNIAFLRDNTRLLAPFSGVITGKYFESGEMFSGTPVPTVGKAAIVSLAQIDMLKTIVPVSEKFFPLVKTGMEVTITTDIYPDKEFTGRVFRIHPTVDPTSRTFNVEISIDNRNQSLRPGMFSRVRFSLDRFDAMIVPAIAVLKLQGSNERYLFVEKDGIARRIGVTIGKRYDENVEVIAEGLHEGDNIIVSGQARLQDGTQVTVVK